MMDNAEIRNKEETELFNPLRKLKNSSFHHSFFHLYISFLGGIVRVLVW